MIQFITKVLRAAVCNIKFNEIDSCGYHQLTPAEAVKFVEENLANPNYLVIDVRTPDEYRKGHVKTAINIDYFSDDFQMTLSRYERSKNYLVYCKSGSRAKASLIIFKRLGFENIFYLREGYGKLR